MKLLRIGVEAVVLFLIGIFILNSFLTLPALLKYDLYRRFKIESKIINITSWFEPSKKTRAEEAVKYIVVHHDGIDFIGNVPISEIASYHKMKLGTFAYHFYIATDGAIYKAHEITEILNHAAPYNSISIAICLQGDFNKISPSEKQISSFNQLIKLLQFQFQNIEIIGHKEINNTTCPGANFEYHKITEINGTTKRFYTLLEYIK